MKDPVLYTFVPLPAQSEVTAKYLDLGWEEVMATSFAPARLRWHMGRGTPIHPGEGLIAAVSGRGIDDLLGWRLVNQMLGRLPDATGLDGDFLEVKVEVSVCFQRKGVKGRHKGSGTLQSWDLCNARVEMLRGA